MNTVIPKLKTRLKDALLLIMAFPFFLLISIILWEIILGVDLLSVWLCDQGWLYLGAFVKIITTILAIAVLVGTANVLFGSVVMAWQTIMGSKSPSETQQNRQVWILTAVAYAAGAFFWAFKYDGHDSLQFGIYCCLPILALVILIWSRIRKFRARNGSNG